jgi:hypothetical protein
MRDSAAFDVLAAKIDELARVCDQLTRENAELRGEVTRLSGGAAPATVPSHGDLAGAHTVSSHGVSGHGVGGHGLAGHGAGGQHAAGHGKRSKVTRRGFGLSAIAGAAVAVLGSASLFAERGFKPARGAASGQDAPAFAVEDAAFETAAFSLGTGASVVNASLSTTGGTVTGANAGTGAGVYGKSSSSAGVGVYAVNSSTGAAINAVSGHGRGGIFAGSGAAQIQLTPGGSRPKSGQVGDLYVDHSGDLWFCKKTSTTAATWKQIA